MLFNEILIKMHPIWFMALIEYTERLLFSAFQKECIQRFSKYFNCKEYWEKQFWGVNVPTISMHWITMRFCVIVIFDNNPHLTFYTITNKIYTNTCIRSGKGRQPVYLDVEMFLKCRGQNTIISIWMHISFVTNNLEQFNIQLE